MSDPADTRRSTAIDHLLDCLEKAVAIAKRGEDAATLVKCGEVYLDLAKLLGEKSPAERPMSPRVSAGLKAEGG